MPEVQISKQIVHMITCRKGMQQWMKDDLFRLEIVPITYSKKRGTLVPCPTFKWHSPRKSGHWVSYAPAHWIERADQDSLGDWMAVVPYAPLICKSRGKLICLAAGPHALVICLALETNIIGMPVETYRRIVAQDYPGPNEDEERAEQELRIFHLPPDFVEPHSSPSPRTIKIVAAFVSENWAWVINDFSSTLIMRLFSRDEPWTDIDFEPGNKTWCTLFDSIKKGGPDWVTETSGAKERLKEWRESILRDYRNKHCQRRLTFTNDDDREPSVVYPNSSYCSLFRPLLAEILQNRFNSFAGIGRYSANDLLHTLGIYPFTPSFVICQNDDLFQHFERGIYDYISQFSKPEYLQRASSVPNTSNPFSFNDHLNTEFMAKWILVYKRTKAVVPVTLYNKLLSQGLLDEDHTIGQPYHVAPERLLDPAKRKWVYLRVKKHIVSDNEKLNAYTVIVAKPPTEWGLDVVQTFVRKDLSTFCFNTTIGPPQFRVQVLNRPYFKNLEPGTLAIGRPKTYHTGKRGRPRKGPSKKRLDRYAAGHKGRNPI